MFLLLQAVLANEQAPLLRQAHSDSCLLRAIQGLSLGCSSLTDLLKSQLAVQFSNCILRSADRETIECSQTRCLKDMSQSQWNTYTTYMAHLDDLCHYYSQMDWEQRRMHLLDRLINVSTLSYSSIERALGFTLQLNSKQDGLRTSIDRTLAAQRVSDLEFAARHSDLRKQQSQLFQQIKNINSVFSSHSTQVKQLIGGLGKLGSQIAGFSIFTTSLSATLGLYLFLAFIVFLLSLVRSQEGVRHYCLSVLAVSLLAELVSERYMSQWIALGIRILLVTHVFLQGLQLKSGKRCQSVQQFDRLEQLVRERLNSGRLSRLVRDNH